MKVILTYREGKSSPQGHRAETVYCKDASWSNVPGKIVITPKGSGSVRAVPLTDLVTFQVKED
jgi:hypothetical protein